MNEKERTNKSLNKRWANDIQYPRLIQEMQMAGIFTPELKEQLIKSMNINIECLDSLIDRSKIDLRREGYLLEYV